MCFLIKGFLPWKPRYGDELLSVQARIKVKDLKDYFNDLEHDFVKIYRLIKDLFKKDSLEKSDYE
jgi:hypothetical protein